MTAECWWALLPEDNTIGFARSWLCGTVRNKKAPGLHRGLRSVREKGAYRLTAILACRSVGRTIGNGGLVTTSLTQRASPPLK